jgi:penicillin-binding protein 2
MGIEDWGQEYLAGKPSANLYVRTPAKEVVTILSSREAEPSYSIYTTLDANVQLWAQLALRDFTGAVVVMERDTGRVLAMASSPSFNPNHSNPNNPFSILWGDYFDGTYDQPMFNRATMGQYPPGSIFKIISLAAALESGEYLPNKTFECEHFWYGPDGSPWEDWTYEKGRNPSGVLNMMEGLMRSCNPLFYEIGYKLLISDHGNAITDMAREFGLGSVTGIGVIPEESGNIISPEEISSKDGTQLWVNAIQQAIGQSETTITPLQAAAYIAAIGNGGTLYQPQLIERVENTAGDAILAFEPIVNNTLPLSDETMAALWEGLLLVTKNTRGTAYSTFGRVNFPITVYGKTGTASVGGGLDPHAWFIGFTDQPEDPLLPDIAVAVVVENMGDGSEFAAPIFRRVVEAYFYTSPTYKYPWESSLFIFNPDYFPTEDETEGGE